MDLGPRLRSAGSTLVYGVAPWRRLVFAVIGAMIVALMIYDRRVSVFPLVLAVGALSGSLYADDWVFRLSHKTFEHRVGVYPFVRREEFSTGSVMRLQIEKIGLRRHDASNSTELTGGGWLGLRRRDRRFYKLSVELDDGRTRVLNIGRAGHNQLLHDAERLAEALGTELAQRET